VLSDRRGPSLLDPARGHLRTLVLTPFFGPSGRRTLAQGGVLYQGRPFRAPSSAVERSRGVWRDEGLVGRFARQLSPLSCVSFRSPLPSAFMT
jgi:hypothetical protein